MFTNVILFNALPKVGNWIRTFENFIQNTYSINFCTKVFTSYSQYFTKSVPNILRTHFLPSIVSIIRVDFGLILSKSAKSLIDNRQNDVFAHTAPYSASAQPYDFHAFDYTTHSNRSPKSSDFEINNRPSRRTTIEWNRYT